MKRAKGDNLTGGSKDVNPQWFNVNAAQVVADVNNTVSVPLPVQRLSQRSGRSLVMEILKLQFDMPVFQPVGGGVFSFLAILATKNLNILPVVGLTGPQFFSIRTDGGIIQYVNRQLVAGSSNDGTVVIDDPQQFDLTDSNGHGVLVATDNLYLSIVTVVGGSSPTGGANNFLCRILYRWKEVSLEEYIGIVQSQQ